MVVLFRELFERPSYLLNSVKLIDILKINILKELVAVKDNQGEIKNSIGQLHDNLK